MSRGRRASLPGPGWELGEETESGGSPRVFLRLEDNPNYAFDLSRMHGPETMRASLASAVEAWSASASGGRRTWSVLGVRRGVSAFLRWVEFWNQEVSSGARAKVHSMADFTPFHLRQYKAYLRAEHTTLTFLEYYCDITVLLKYAPGVSADTLREASKRRGDAPPPSRPVQRYSNQELFDLKKAARQVFMAAWRRITSAHALSRQYDDPSCLDPERSSALHEVIVHGKPQTVEGVLALGATGSTSKRVGGVAAARRQLFLSPDEVFAAAVLLACHRGLNLSPIVTALKPIEHEPGVLQLDLDKPRRGPSARFWPEILTGQDNDGEDDDGAAVTILARIVEATDPARAYLSASGQPAERLLIYWPDNAAAPRLGIPSWGTRKKAAWIPAGTILEWRRLRRSIPGMGAAKEPTDHSPDTHLHYVRSDPVALLEQQEEAERGVQKMVDHARASLAAIRVDADRNTDPGNDAVLVSCSDPQHRPDTGRPCTTGFYSFLDCLECANAATVPRLLPRQLAAREVLESLRDSMGEAWERRFARHYYTLVALLNRHTAAELDLAAPHVSQYIPIIVAALRNEVPA